MGQRYDGTLVIQTKDSTSPTGNYVLSVLSDQAEEKDIINNKQGYNGTGNIITGTNKKGYAGQVFSETEMDSYLTEENVGRILQYLGQAEGSEGGTPVPVNPIAVGDTISTLYFDTSVDVLSLFAGVEGTSENGISFTEISDTILVKYMRGVVLVSRVVDEAPVTVYYMSQDVLGLGWTGWNPEFSGSDIFNATVSSIDADNDKYLSFISKTPFTGGSAYTTGATYQVVNDGTAIVFKEIRI